MRLGPVALALALADPATAKQICPPETPAPAPCLVGFWVGSSTAPAAVGAMLNNLAPSGSVRMVVPMMPTDLAMGVAPDGSYATMPFATHQEFIDYSERADPIHTDMTLVAGSEFGRIWNTGNRLMFCSLGVSFATFITLAEGGGRSTADVQTLGPELAAGYVPDISFECTADTLLYTVNLPDPVGPVQYFLFRTDGGLFPEPLRRALSGPGLPPFDLPEGGADALPTDAGGATGDAVTPVEPEEVIVPVVPVEVPIPVVPEEVIVPVVPEEVPIPVPPVEVPIPAAPGDG